MEIASISIGTGLDLSGAMRDLKRFGMASNTTVKLKAEVDDKALTALNKHLSLKQVHIKAVARDFKANVIRPVVDDRALTQLNKSLDIAQGGLKNLLVKAQQLKGLGGIQVKPLVGVDISRGNRSVSGRAKNTWSAIPDGLNAGIKNGTSTLQKSAESMASVVISAAKKKLEIRSPSGAFRDIGEMVVKGLELGLQGFGEVFKSFDDLLSQLEVKAGLSQGALKNLGIAAKGAAIGFVGFQALSFILESIAGDTLRAAMEMEKFERSMKFVTGSASKAQANFAALRAEAKALGTDLRNAIAGQTQLAAATKGTSLEGAGTDQIGQAARQASSVFGLNAEEADRVNLAITQMASKGKVSAEELRQQLGEVLPGAFQIFARSIGVTTAQLDGMLQRGEVGTDSLIKFAAQLKAETSTGVAGAANSSQAALNRFNNEIYDLQTTLGAKLLPVQNMGLALLTAALESLSVIVPVVSVAMLGFATKSLLAVGGGAAKGAIVALAPMAGWTALFLLISDAITTMGEVMSDTEGASKDFASSATKGLREYLALTGQAVNETKKFGDEIKTFGSDNFIAKSARALLGEENGNRWLRFQERRIDDQGQTFYDRPEKEGRDMIRQNQEASKAADEMQRRLNEQLARFTQGGGALRQVRETDIKMRDLQSRRGLLGAGDDSGRAAIDKEYQQLAQDREKLSSEVNALNAQVRANIEGRKAANKQIEEALRVGGMSTQATAQLRSQFEANTKAIEEGEVSLKEYAKAINTAIVGAAKLEAQLQGINTAAQYRDLQNDLVTTQTQGAIALAQTNGQLTPGQAQSAQAASEQSAQTRTIESLNTTIAQLNSLLNDPTTSRAFALSGLSSNSTSSDIGQYIAGFTGDRESEEFKILQQAQTQRQQLESLQLQAAQAATQIQQSKLQTQESVKQTTREINEFIRNIGRNVEDIGRTIEQQDLETQIQQTKNELHRNLSGFSDRFFGDFIGGLDQMIDLINEPLRRMSEAQGTIAGLARGVSDAQLQGIDLMRNAQGGAFMMGGGGSQVGASVAALALGREGTEFRAGVAEQCANFVRDVFKQAGIELGVTGSPVDGLSTGAALANSFFGSDIGQIIRDPSQLRAGDIVGYANTYGNWAPGTITHVGVYAGNNEIVDRSTSSAPIRRRALDTFSMDGFVAVRPHALANAMSGDSHAASQSSAGSNVDRYMNRLAFLESNFDAGATGYAPVEGGGRAQGAFQFTPITVQDATAAGIGDPRQGTLAEQAQKAYQFIQNFHPEAASAIESGNFSAADRILRGRWVSLPGGSEQQGDERMTQANQFLQGQGLRFSVGGGGSGNASGGGMISIPGADTSGINPALNQYSQAIDAQRESILAQVAAQDQQSAIQLRQQIQASRQKLTESQRTIIDETRQYNQRYQDSILAAFGDSPIAQALQQLAADSRDVEQSTRDMQRTIEDASLSLENLTAVRDRIANDPNLAQLRELIPGMDAAIAEYEQQIGQIELARDREQRILNDRRNAIIENLEASGRAELRALTNQNEDLRIQQQAMMISDAGLRDLVAARAERNSLRREFEESSQSLIAQIGEANKGIERLKAEGFAVDSDEVVIATREVENLTNRLDALESNSVIQLQLIDQNQLELLRQYNAETRSALTAAQVENAGYRSDTFGANQLQYMSERNRIMEDYRSKMDSINQAEIQMAGQAGYSAEQFARMRVNLIDLSNVSLDNLRQQFPDLATTINQTAFNAFQGLSGSISALIKGTGSLEDVFDSFASTIIDRLVDIGVQWAASKLFTSFFDGGGASGGMSALFSPTANGTGGGGDTISSILSSGISLLGGLGFNNGGLIPGRYSGSPDRHIARVNPGEFIMRREAVAMHGVSRMNAINAGRFANGGYYNPDDKSPKYKDYTASMGDRDSSPVKVEYSVTEINSVRYVSEEQFQRGLQATSTATEKRINRSMRNSPSYRAGVGI
jgi:tape measure domain-containing protein